MTFRKTQLCTFKLLLKPRMRKKPSHISFVFIKNRLICSNAKVYKRMVRKARLFLIKFPAVREKKTSFGSIYLKILPWLNFRPSLSSPSQLRYWLTKVLVSSEAGSSFFHS